MKKIKKILFFILFFSIAMIGLASSSNAASGDTGTYGDLQYKEYDETITITRLLNKTTVTEVAIPEEIVGKPVTSISGNFAVPSDASEEVALKKITIPATVQSVGTDYYGAFMNAVNLEEIMVDSNSEYLCSIDGVLYSKDQTKLIAYPANKADTIYTIPNTITKIQGLAFAFAQRIETVIIPESVTTIERSCFAQSSIKTLTIPENVERVETYLCYKCPNLITVEINTNGYINMDAFYGCTSLTTVTIGDRCTYIRSGAFQNCTSLKTVNFETSKIETIETRAFQGCSSLPRTIKMPSTLFNVSKSSFDSDVTLEFAGDDYVEATDEWNKCVNITVNATQDYTVAYEVFNLVNEQRATENLAALKLDKKLMDIAMQRAYEISVYYAHRRAEVYRGFAMGNSNYDAQIFMNDTIYRMGLTGQVTFSAENIARNYVTAEAVMNGWMNSPGHKANILGADYTTVGIGAIKTANGYLWVQIFGNDTYTPEITRSNTTETRIIPVTNTYISKYVGYEGVTLVCNKSTINAGSTTQINVKSYFTYADSVTYLEQSGFEWSSSNSKVATVDQNGNVTGLSGGTADITITLSDGQTRSITITVNSTLLKGDVNKDGKINLYDALQILKQAILGGDLSDEMLYIMDYNDDGKVNLYDALKFLQQAILR